MTKIELLRGRPFEDDFRDRIVSMTFKNDLWGQPSNMAFEDILQEWPSSTTFKDDLRGQLLRPDCFEDDL